jgi:hypothetical protein
MALHSQLLLYILGEEGESSGEMVYKGVKERTGKQMYEDKGVKERDMFFYFIKIMCWAATLGSTVATQVSS